MTAGVIGSTSSFGYGPGGFYRSWSGTDGKVETVDGRKRDKWNPYTVTRRSYSQTLTHWTSNPNYPIYFYNIYSNPTFASHWTDSDELALQGKLVSKVRGHDFNLAVNVAQGRQLVDMVVNNLGKFRKAIRALKHGDFSTASRALGSSPKISKLNSKDISGRWLELQYGWLPVLSDTYEAAKAFEVISKYRTSRIRVTRNKFGTYNASQSTSSYDAIGKYWLGKQIVYEMTEQLSAPRSLGLADPLSVIWEIIPYSFVIDWFLPIGSYLDNLSVIPTLEGRFLTTAILKYRSEVSTVKFSYPDFFPGKARYSISDLSRSVSTSLTTVRPSFVPLPRALSGKRIYNAVALTHQAFRR